MDWNDGDDGWKGGKRLSKTENRLSHIFFDLCRFDCFLLFDCNWWRAYKNQANKQTEIRQ